LKLVPQASPAASLFFKRLAEPGCRPEIFRMTVKSEVKEMNQNHAFWFTAKNYAVF
jgi:hypothetical protein